MNAKELALAIIIPVLFILFLVLAFIYSLIVPALIVVIVAIILLLKLVFLSYYCVKKKPKSEGTNYQKIEIKTY